MENLNKYQHLKLLASLVDPYVYISDDSSSFWSLIDDVVVALW